MGRGYIFHCKKCGYKLKPHLGVGFLFPQEYQETIEAAKNGQYGKTVQTFLEEHPDGVLNCDKVLLQCTECGNIKTERDMSMYVPKQGAEPRKNGRWSVAAPFEGAAYVAPWDLKQYDLVCRYDHRCEKCGAGMKAYSEKDMEKKLGTFFIDEQQTEFACPKCGDLLWNIGEIMWD